MKISRLLGPRACRAHLQRRLPRPLQCFQVLPAILANRTTLAIRPIQEFPRDQLLRAFRPIPLCPESRECPPGQLLLEHRACPRNLEIPAAHQPQAILKNAVIPYALTLDLYFIKICRRYLKLRSVRESLDCPESLGSLLKSPNHITRSKYLKT